MTLLAAFEMTPYVYLTIAISMKSDSIMRFLKKEKEKREIFVNKLPRCGS
jgi:hypothetical protein